MRAVDLQPVLGPGVADRAAITGLEAGRAALAPGQSSGYHAICADYTCEPNTPGFIRNELMSGPGVVVIPPNAVSIKLNNLILTPMAPA